MFCVRAQYTKNGEEFYWKTDRKSAEIISALICEWNNKPVVAVVEAIDGSNRLVRITDAGYLPDDEEKPKREVQYYFIAEPEKVIVGWNNQP